jgi:hypothetical protein
MHKVPVQQGSADAVSRQHEAHHAEGTVQGS